MEKKLCFINADGNPQCIGILDTAKISNGCYYYISITKYRTITISPVREASLVCAAYAHPLIAVFESSLTPNFIGLLH